VTGVQTCALPICDRKVLHIISPELCIDCGACGVVCPTDAIRGSRKALHAISSRLCIDCGACGVVCPTSAILDARGVASVLLKKPQRPRAFVDELACTGCEKCVDRCAFDALLLDEGAAPRTEHFGVMRVEEARCTGCRECQDACPYDAIFVFRRDQRPDWLAPSVAA